jgi:hypothetical protein
MRLVQLCLLENNTPLDLVGYAYKRIFTAYDRR